MQEMTRLQDSESGMDSPRADSELDLATSDFSAPELLQVQQLPPKTPALPMCYSLTCAACIHNMSTGHHDVDKPVYPCWW